MRYFEVRFLKEADEFLCSLEAKAARKLLYNLDLASQTNDPRLFKKLVDDIWEFRINFSGVHYRLLAFWDKANKDETLVIATHGFIKKVDKVPANEIRRAVRLRRNYFLDNESE